jgi:hypothetical protein
VRDYISLSQNDGGKMCDRVKKADIVGFLQKIGKMI